MTDREFCPMHDANKHMLRIVGVGFAIVLVVLAVLSFTLLRAVDDANDRQDAQRARDKAEAAYTLRQRQQIEQKSFRDRHDSCERGDDVRAWIRFRSSSTPNGAPTRASKLFPILDCEPFLTGGTGKPMSEAEQEAFIRSLFPTYKP